MSDKFRLLYSNIDILGNELLPIMNEKWNRKTISCVWASGF